MNTTHITRSGGADGAVLLAREVDDLLLRLRGLVLVRDLLTERGATRAEVDAHTDEVERIRRRLAEMIRGRATMRGPVPTRGPSGESGIAA